MDIDQDEAVGFRHGQADPDGFEKERRMEMDMVSFHLMFAGFAQALAQVGSGKTDHERDVGFFGDAVLPDGHGIAR